LATTTLQRALLGELKAMAERLRDDWDYLPVIGSLHLAGDGIACEPWPIPNELWEKIPPPRTIYFIAERLAEVPELLGQAIKGVVAVFFCCEGWTVPTELNDTPEITAARKTHSFHKLAERIEVRIISAIDKDGATYFVNLQRGGEVTGYVEDPDPEVVQPRSGGIVFDALDQLAVLVLGTERRERQTAIKEDEADD
jgi:hypothetical protein